MKLNGLEIHVSPYTSESINNEMVMFNEERKLIIVLNHTAMLVWKEITESYLRNSNISTNDIAYTFRKTYNIAESDFDIVCSDIDETINMFFQSSLLKLVDPRGISDLASYC